MNFDVLVAEIGSTTTVVNAFDTLSSLPTFVGQGQAATTVTLGDVRVGLLEAIEDLKNKLAVSNINYKEMLATSSAAGGLKMTVHGLVQDMTVRAAKEAALGAGANIHMITSGKMRESDLRRLKDIQPNIILLAGGVDYGERDTVLYNGNLIKELSLDVPVIYAGNIENHDDIRIIFENSGYKLYVVENVYPQLDELNVEPTRKVIQDVFEEHIIHAPGMEFIRDLVNGPIIPTPGAVMEATKMIYNEIGDVITLDVGGATTDLHSVTEGSDEISRILISPEPKAKRTVEGDLGVYVNVENIVSLIGEETLEKELGFPIEPILSNYPPIPKTKEEEIFVSRLTKEAVIRAVRRHVGRYRYVYGTSGKTTLAEGKDLTAIKYVVGTGGALTRLSSSKEILQSVALQNPTKELLVPKDTVRVLIDKEYIMASLGVLSKVHYDPAFLLMKKSFGL